MRSNRCDVQRTGCGDVQARRMDGGEDDGGIFQRISMNSRLKQYLGQEFVGLLLALIALIVFFSLQSEYFLSVLTFTTLANQMPALLVIAVGMTFVLIIAGIDLSVGSVVALCGAVLGLAIVELQLPLWLAASLCLLTGLFCGLFNGAVECGSFISMTLNGP